MTDKQIIIDGVDVSGCEDYRYFNNAHYCDLHYTRKLCEDLHNCYYKQLKRKEQECANNEIAHKKELEIFNQECIDTQEQLMKAVNELDQLKAENEILKEKLERQKDYMISYKLYTIEQKQKLKQALDGVEEYALKQFCDNCEEIGSTELISHCEYCEYNEIFNNINKAKEQE